MKSERPPPIGDGWYRSEEPTRRSLVFELQRIKRRVFVRPLPVLAITIAITAAVTYKFALKPHVYVARVTLALNEGAIDDRHGIPFDTLNQYVTSVLMPDKKLLQLIEQRNLHRLRKKLGPEFAIEELRSQLEVEIWKNQFVFYSEEDSDARKSARIGLSVSDANPDLAFGIVRDIATIVMETHEEQRRLISEALSQEVATISERTSQRQAALAAELSAQQAALKAARERHEDGLAAALASEIAAMDAEGRRLQEQQAAIVRSPEALTDQAIAAGLGTTLQIVEERRPREIVDNWMGAAIIIIVIGTGALIGAALFVGAFDSRVHDVDDVTRLNLPVLGHVPGFQGDHVGSLRSRGVRRGRVPSWLRWRS
jgi:hypothetical protein